MFCLAICLLPVPAAAGPPPSAGRFRISLLTVDPGPEIYSSWGHTALRIDDARTGQQFVFDYGLFRFDSAFLFRFLKGDPIYMLGVSSWQKTELRYRSGGRRIRAQELSLPPAEAEAFARILALNAQPQNRAYVYNHFTNNCTTVYRDHLDRILGGVFARTYRSRPSGRTLREITTAPLADRPFVRLGVHLILNGRTDLAATAWQEMFLPEALLRHLDAVRHADQTAGVLVGPVQTVLAPPPHTALLRPFLGWLLCALLASSFGAALLLPDPTRRRQAEQIAFWLWCLSAGALGTVLFLLNFFSAFDIFHHNLNLFAFHPLLLLWPFLDWFVIRRWGEAHGRLLHATFVAWPLVGLVLALSNYSNQYSEPFLFTAVLAHGLLFVARERRTRRVTRG